MKVNIIREMFLSETLRNRYGLEKTPEVQKNIQECCKAERKVMDALGKENVNLFFELEDACSIVRSDEMYDAFVIGLRTGAAITRFMMKKKNGQR